MQLHLATVRVLLVEDVNEDAWLMERALNTSVELQFATTRVGSLEEARERLAAWLPELVLLDLALPDSQGLNTIDSMLGLIPQVPIIVLTGLDDEALAIQAVARGAQDYLVKDRTSSDLLIRSIRYALERKRLEERLRLNQQQFQLQLQDSMARLQQVDRLKDTFIAVLTHEIRSPLQLILGYAQMLKQGVLAPDRAQDALTAIYHGATSQANIISNLLDFAQLEAGSLELVPEAIQLAEVLAEAVDEVKERLAHKQLRLAAELSPDLPRIQADPQRLRQILVNLLDHAGKVTPPEGQVWVRARDQGDGAIRISVHDGGEPLAEGQQALLFERFGHMEASRAQGIRGTVLGLPLAQALIAAQGGRLWIEPAPPQGNAFQFTLPAASPK